MLSSPWVVQLLARPAAFERLSTLIFSGRLPWTGLVHLAALPALTVLQARVVQPSTDR